MKKLKLNLQNIEGAEVLSREQLKTVMGGGSGEGRCVIVGSTNGQDSCWYTTGSASDLCDRVYGKNCDHEGGYGDGVECDVNNCTMN